MTVLFTSSTRYSNVVKYEQEPSQATCRDAVIFNGPAGTYKVGTALGSYLASPTGTAGAIVGTGNGAMGAITVTSNANLQTGTYTLKINKAASNAGDFVVVDTQGDVVGTGTVGVAFAGGGLAFTLADGSTDFIVGDTIPIVVAGTVKYKQVEATATDGSEVTRAILLSDAIGTFYDQVIVATTDTTVLALTRGRAIVSKSLLVFGTSVNTAPLLAVAYAQLKAVGILAETTV